MLGEATVLDPDHVGRYPCDGTAGVRELAMDEQAIPAWFDMSTVLDA